MTLAVAPDPIVSPLRPGWLRPAAHGAAVGVHALIVGAFLYTAAEPPASTSDAFDVAYVADGEAAQAHADSAPDAPTQNAESAEEQEASEAQQAEAPATRTPVTETPISQVKPDVIAPDALAVPLAAKPPQDEQKPIFDQPVEKKPNDATPDKTIADGKVMRQASLEAEASAAASASAERAGVADGKNTQNTVSRARYGARVLAEIQKHMFYPRIARGAGVRGDAVVVFTVGVEGRIIDRKIMRSTGNEALDAAALTMLDSVRAPPPPAGHFFGKTTIKFAIRH